MRELAAVFLKLGTVAFGGPAAHIALMEEEIVGRRGWLSQADFLDMLGATNLIPGPNSTEMALHVGYRRAGWRGLIVAGLCFILPSAVIVFGIAAAYVRFGRLPLSVALLDGVKPVVIAIVAQALWRLGRTALRTPLLAGVALVGSALSFAGVHELLILGGCSLLFVAARAGARRAGTPAAVVLPWLAPTAAGAATAVGLGPLFLVFLKIGSVLFGSGYVLLAFLRADLVTRLHWLTESQLLDATAVGQVTPGPLSTTATFIGYLVAGPKGALLATLGIFLPAFVFVAASAPFLPALRRSPTAAVLLDGLNAASLALMAVVSLQLARSAVHDLTTAAIALGSAVLLFGFRIDATWLVLGGAVVGLLAQL